MPSRRSVPLPRGWTKHVKSSLLHAISLASMALTIVRSRRPRSPLQAELDRTDNEIALLKEELAIKEARWGRVPLRRRPHFTPIQRMRILQVKAARGWSCEQAAKAFMIDEQTMRSWLRRVDEEGEGAHSISIREVGLLRVSVQDIKSMPAPEVFQGQCAVETSAPR